MASKKVHIFGASGLLGSSFANYCSRNNISTVKYSNSNKDIEYIDVDITKIDQVLSLNGIKEGDYIVNLAAIAQPQEVLKNEEYAYSVNVNGNKNLYNLAANNNCKYFFMSSVEVFGNETTPILESCKPNPLNKYGEQKMKSEQALQQGNYTNFIIGRTSWNISSNQRGRCLTKVMIDSLRQDNAKMATDNIFTIASSYETAANIMKSMQSNFKGVVHIASPTPISRYEIAQLVINNYCEKGLSCMPCKFSDLTFSEERSRLNILDTSFSIKNFDAVYSDPSAIIIKKIESLNKNIQEK